MTWKVWILSVLVALGLGFGGGIFIKGRHETAKAIVAEQQIKQLGDAVQKQMVVRKIQEGVAATAQTQANTSDAKVRQLTARLAARPKPVPLIPNIPATGPALPVVDAPTPDPLKDELIAAQAKDIADQKNVITKLNLQIATDNSIINDQTKQIALGKIALDAQVAANADSKWTGRFQGGSAVGIACAVAYIVTHL